MATTIEFNDPRLPRRFWDRVKRSTNGCWHWTGSLTSQNYGQCSPPPGESRLAHRFVYNRVVEPLPHPRGHEEYRDVDHECHNRSKSCPGGKSCRHRRCVNPAHLAAKTQRDNLYSSPHMLESWRQRTHCRKRGHPMVGENLYIAPNGNRACRACMNINQAAKLKGGRTYERKTHCPQGHPYDGENLYVSPRGTRHCRTCRKH